MDEELIPVSEEELALDIAVMVAAKVIKPLVHSGRREMADAERAAWADEFARLCHRRGLRFSRVKPPLGNQ